MSYIEVVNPAILAAAGIPDDPAFTATVSVAAFGCYLMAFYANRPFAIAPYMGENAFIAFTDCKLLGLANCTSAIFLAGVDLSFSQFFACGNGWSRGFLCPFAIGGKHK